MNNNELDFSCKFKSFNKVCGKQSSVFIDGKWFCSYHFFCYSEGKPESLDMLTAYDEYNNKNKKIDVSSPLDKLFYKSDYSEEDIISMKKGADYLLSINPTLKNIASFQSFYKKLYSDTPEINTNTDPDIEEIPF